MLPLPALLPSPATAADPARVTRRAWQGIAIAVATSISAAAWAPAAVVTRGPYLQSGAETRIVVRWRTDVATDSRVSYGEAPGSLTFTAGDPALTTEHAVTLTGLTPETRYYYAVGTTTTTLAGGDTAHTLLTPPPAGTHRPVRMWVIGDAGTANDDAGAVRDAYQRYAGGRHTGVWLLLGDNAYDFGTDTEYQAAVFDRFPALLRRTAAWPTRGNHDEIHPGPNDDMFEIFDLPTAGECGGVPSGSEAYYSFDAANVHFVCLDSEGTYRLADGPMLTWLANDLATTQQDWVIAFWHHPPYSKGSHNSDNRIDSGGRMSDMREQALPILEGAGVDLVLTAHSHSYERSYLLDGHYGRSPTLDGTMILDPGDGRTDGDGPYRKPTAGRAPHQGTVYAVVGCSGEVLGGPLNHRAMFIGLATLGSMVVHVEGHRLDARFLDALGVVRDSFTILKGTNVVTRADDPHDDPHGGPVLSGARPSPFSARARIGFTLPSAGRARLSIFDLAGRRVRELISGEMAAGRHEADWDGADQAGRRVSPGLYFAALEFRGATRARKLVLAE